MKNFITLAVFAFALSIQPVAAQEKFSVGGSGVLGDALDDLAKLYRQKNPSDPLNVVPDSMSTTGGIEGTKVGRLTIGIITRHLNEQEKKEGLVYRGVARMPVVVGVHKSLPVSNVSEAQVCDIFSGKVKNWKDVGGSDHKIIVLTRKKDDNNVEVFRDKMACFKSIQIASDAVLNNRPGTVALSLATPNMTERPNIKSISVGNVAPTLEAVKSGKYKYYNEAGFITAGEPKGAAKRFVDFVATADAERILEKYGMVAAR
jgi:phosphate transport system substrate-binding protein